jgi:hypothetical protein
MENKLQIPEILLFNIIKAILQTIREDLANNIDEKNTLFYKLFYGTKFNDINLDFYANAKDIFSRDKSHPRYLDLRMFFNADRAEIPTIHLNLPSESDIGGGIGVDAGYNGTNYDPINKTIFQNHTRSFNSVYNIIITSDNSDEVLIIYHALKAFMVSMLDIIDLNGLRNPKLGGADLQINPELIPPHVFIRAISLNCFYELTVPSLIKEKIIRKIRLQSLSLIEEEAEISILESQDFVVIIDGEKRILKYVGEGYTCLFGSTPATVIDNGIEHNVMPGAEYTCEYGPAAPGECHNTDSSISIEVPSGGTGVFPDGELTEYDGSKTPLIAGKNVTAKVPGHSLVTNTDNDLLLDLAPGQPGQIADSIGTNYDGSTFNVPATNSFNVPVFKKMLFGFPVDSELTNTTAALPLDFAATWNSNDLENVATIQWKVNGANVSLPFTTVVGDTVTAVITKTNAALAASATLKTATNG